MTKEDLDQLFKNFNLKEFYLGELIKKPDVEGCVLMNNVWYLYSTDNLANITYTGPFRNDSIVYACALRLNLSKHFKKYKFSKDDRHIYMHNHYRES